MNKIKKIIFLLLLSTTFLNKINSQTTIQWGSQIVVTKSEYFPQEVQELYQKMKSVGEEPIIINIKGLGITLKKILNDQYNVIMGVKYDQYGNIKESVTITVNDTIYCSMTGKMYDIHSLVEGDSLIIFLSYASIDNQLLDLSFMGKEKIKKIIEEYLEEILK